MMWSWQNELPRGKTEHSTDERADTVAFAPDVEDADADDEDDPSRSDADLSDDGDGWGLAEMVREHLISSQFFSKRNAFQIGFTPPSPLYPKSLSHIFWQ